MAIAVIDIGKTNAKVVLVDPRSLAEIAERRIVNEVARDGLYPHFRAETLWAFILDSLTALGREAAIETISITAHGATAVVVDEAGGLALPILDYEHAAIDELAAAYDRIRPPFAETGSPRLPGGLNVGAQLFWQQQTFPDQWKRAAAIMTYPQYWARRLTGVPVSEVTSLGCHTDLWNPHTGTFSQMAQHLGWAAMVPPIAKAADRLGPLLPELAARTGLSPETPVLCGIHDSNASLLGHLLARDPPFAVLSTGTWVVALAPGARPVALDASRDTLINVNALGSPVPSARFMGGRENAILSAGLPPATTPEAIAATLARRLFYLPNAHPGSGPFPAAKGRWTGEGSPEERRAAVSFYLALMAATCLELIGAEGPVIVEGPFSSNPEFGRMLRAATGRPLVMQTAGTGTSVGAALLATGRRPLPAGESVSEPGPDWAAYAGGWRAAVTR